MRILFVCLGNICRSPLAEALFVHKIKERNIQDQFEVASCGTANYHIGDAPDPRTIKNAFKNGVIIDHVGRQLSESDFKYFDLILAMDKSNYDNIFRLKGAMHYSDNIQMMRDYDPQAKGKDVPDPWYGNEDDFQNVFEILDRSTENLIEALQKK